VSPRDSPNHHIRNKWTRGGKKLRKDWHEQERVTGSCWPTSQMKRVARGRSRLLPN